MSYTLFDSSWKEIIFEKRNKNYGAYELRTEYDKNISRALILAILFAALSVGGPMIYKFLKPTPGVVKEEMIEVDLEKLPPPPENPNEPPPPPPPIIEMPKVETIKFLPPEVKKDEEVVEPPPTIEEVKEAVIANKTEEGVKGDEMAVVQEEAPVAIESPKEEEVFTVVEQMPQFPGGGVKEMQLFIIKNFVYSREATNMGIEGKVYVSFEVGTDGKIEKVQVLKGLGYGLDEEAVRVVKKMPSWEPGRMNGRNVKVKMTIPIKLQLSK
ncbi:MAG: energy transducer TonB [Opitutaceae bacterium]|nr:energy transducer TonB [Cytophagales bacterium]